MTQPATTTRLARELTFHIGHEVRLECSQPDGSGVCLYCTDCGEIVVLDGVSIST